MKPRAVYLKICDTTWNFAQGHYPVSLEVLMDRELQMPLEETLCDRIETQLRNNLGFKDPAIDYD